MHTLHNGTSSSVDHRRRQQNAERCGRRAMGAQAGKTGVLFEKQRSVC